MKNTKEYSKFYVYKITNTINNKVYIGKSYNYENRFEHHKWAALKNTDGYQKDDCPKLYNSIRKNGIENFIIESIEEFDDEEKCLLAEKEYIIKYNSIINGYNITDGGTGFSGPNHPLIGKGYLIAGDKNPMFGKVGELNPFYGKAHTPEMIANTKERERKWSNDEIIEIKQLIINGKTGNQIRSIEKYKELGDCAISRIKGGYRYKEIGPDISNLRKKHLEEKDVRNIIIDLFDYVDINDLSLFATVGKKIKTVKFYNDIIKPKYNITLGKTRKIVNRDDWEWAFKEEYFKKYNKEFKED